VQQAPPLAEPLGFGVEHGLRDSQRRAVVGSRGLGGASRTHHRRQSRGQPTRRGSQTRRPNPPGTIAPTIRRGTRPQRLLCPGSHRCSSRSFSNHSPHWWPALKGAGLAAVRARSLILRSWNEGRNRSPEREFSPDLGTWPIQSTRCNPLFSRQAARPFGGAGSQLDRLPVGTRGAKPVVDPRACAVRGVGGPAPTVNSGRQAARAVAEAPWRPGAARVGSCRRL
jgi:hypothetical protein